MTIEERAALAAKRKAEGACNCCQAVAVALADQTGLSEETLMAACSGFAVGMGNMEGTCGSLVAAVMTAGLRLDGKGTLRLSRRISENFSGRCGAVRCRDLKGLTTGKELCSCADCVKNAVLAYGEVMGLE